MRQDKPLSWAKERYIPPTYHVIRLQTQTLLHSLSLDGYLDGFEEEELDGLDGTWEG